MTNLRARIQQIERGLGGNGKHRRVKVYIGVSPDDWPPVERIPIDQQLEMIEAGVRGYICFSDIDQAAEYGFADASPIDQDELDSADIDVSSN